MELLLANRASIDARRTVEDQLRELGERMGFDFMLISAPNGVPLAGVVRQVVPKTQKGQLVPLDPSVLERGNSGFRVIDGRTFQVASVPIDMNDENIGQLSVGEFFDFSDLTTLVVLVHNGKVLESNIPGVSDRDLEITIVMPGAAGVRPSNQRSNWISLPMESYADGFTLLSLDNVDLATAPIQLRLHKLFLELAIACFLVASLCSLGSSNSIVEPIAAVVSRLRNAVKTGKLSELEPQPSSILEIQELAEIYNRAAISVRASGERLHLLIFNLSADWPMPLTRAISTLPAIAGA